MSFTPPPGVGGRKNPLLRPLYALIMYLISLKTFFLWTLNCMHLDIKIQCYDVDIGREDAAITIRSQTDFYPPNPMYSNHIWWRPGRIYKKMQTKTQNFNKKLIFNKSTFLNILKGVNDPLAPFIYTCCLF